MPAKTKNVVPVEPGVLEARRELARRIASITGGGGACNGCSRSSSLPTGPADTVLSSLPAGNFFGQLVGNIL